MKTNLLKLINLFVLQCTVIGAFAQYSPADLQAVGSNERYEITVSWTNTAESDYFGFTIYKQRLDMEWIMEINIPPRADTTYIDTDVEPNVVYIYTDDAGNTALATVARTEPPVPQNVFASPGEYMSVQVSFTDNSEMETWYEVQHTSYLPEFSGDPALIYGKKIATGGSTGSTITTSVNAMGPFGEYYYQPNTTVYVRVRAVIKDGTKYIYGQFSEVVSAVTHPQPETPTDFTATVGVDGKVNLSWTDNSAHEGGFLIARETGEFDLGTRIKPLPPNADSYVDEGIEPNVQYTYHLIAVTLEEYTTRRPDLLWINLITDESRVAKTTIMDLHLPEAPLTLTAEGTSPTSIFVSFSDDSEVENWYDVEIGENPAGPFSPLNYVDNYLSTEITDLNPSTTYYFRVRGVLELQGELFYGPYSEVVSGTTLVASIPASPVAKPATFVTPTEFTANWIAIEGITQYQLDVIEINSSALLSGYHAKVVSATSQLVTGTNPGKRYKYVVRAVNDHGVSSNSNEIVVAPNKGLTLRTICSDDPETNRRWRIINNNPFAIDVRWRVPNTSQTGTLTAAPGDTFFTSQTLPGINYMLITWYDDNLHQHASLKSSTWKSCSETMARDGNETIDESLSFVVDAVPNPVIDKFTLAVNTPDDGDVDVSIFNLQGQQLFKTKVQPNTVTEFDATTYLPGLLLVKTSQNNRVSVFKLYRK